MAIGGVDGRLDQRRVCGASNASSSAEARECAKRCIKDGAAPVFVSEADKKVYKLPGKETPRTTWTTK